MARSRVIPNLLYGALGLATVGTAAYFAIRSIRARRARGDDPMLSLRRSTRKVGRAVKDAGEQVGKDLSRGVDDTIEAFEAEADTYEGAQLNRI